MSMQTLHIVQQFEKAGKRLTAGRQMSFRSAHEAVGRADRDASRVVGIVAIQQTVDTETDEVLKDPIVLAGHGELPAEFDAD